MRFLDIVCLQMLFRDGCVSNGAVPTPVYSGVFLSFRRRCFLALLFTALDPVISEFQNSSRY